MLRRTKIIATLGPSTDDPSALEAVIRAGVDIVRLNFSHGSSEDHVTRFNMVREIADRLNKPVTVLADMQGPKVRIAGFKEGAIELKEGQAFTLDAELDATAGTEHAVGIDYKALPKDVDVADILLLDDGRLELEVTEVDGAKVKTKVLVGGPLSNHKGINRRGGGLSAPSITAKDQKDIQLVAKLGVDYIALSFPKSGEDIAHARDLLAKAKGDTIGIIAKIERYEAIHNILDILNASEGIMVARGDLGVEVGDAALPGMQKRMISQARAGNRVVITATQMMESMITNAIPTRAEVFDVANAVLDGTDAVMLSAETAMGAHPNKVVEAMSRICLGAEQERSIQISTHRMSDNFDRIDETIAMSAMYAANHADVKAIATFTESGATPLWMSRINAAIPIFSFSRHRTTLRKMQMYRGVVPIYLDVTTTDPAYLAQHAMDILQKLGAVTEGDWVILTRGEILGEHGGTNRMKIVRIGDNLLTE